MAMGRRLQAILRMATGHHLSLDPKRLMARRSGSEGSEVVGIEKAMRKGEKLSSSSSLKDQT